MADMAAVVSRKPQGQDAGEPSLEAFATPEQPQTAALPGVAPQPQPSRLAIRCLTEETPASFGDSELNFVIHELLGQGGFGSVYRCSLARSKSEASSSTCSSPLQVGEEFAVKVVDAQRIALLLSSAVDMVVPRLMREAEVLHMLGTHPHIITMHGAFYSRESHKLYFIFELMRGGDLFNAIVRRRQPFRESDARQLFVQLLDAVHYGHSRGVAHRDLKLDNCLIKDVGSLTVKLCDYGQAKVIGLSAAAKTLTTSASYTAPDVQLAVGSARSYDAFKADSYALGVLLYGLLCNALPNAARGSAYQTHAMWQLLSEAARDLLQKLLVAGPEERLSVEDIWQHAWVQLSPLTSRASSGGPSPERRPGEAELKAILAAHQVIVALQRERGNCLGWGGERLQWHLKFTDERWATALQLTDEAFDAPDSLAAPVWLEFRASLSDVCSCTQAVRAYALQALSASRQPSSIDRVCQAYSKLITGVMEAIASALQALCRGDELLGVKIIRHKLLMLTAEQLGRERGLLCGHLQRPECIWDVQVARRINEIVGARKLLLGCSSLSLRGASTSPEQVLTEALAGSDGIVTGESGLLPALSLVDAPLLQAEELAQLEEAEDRVLGLAQASAPQLSEWYCLLTRLIDKIHQHVSLNIVDHFSPLAVQGAAVHLRRAS